MMHQSNMKRWKTVEQVMGKTKFRASPCANRKWQPAAAPCAFSSTGHDNHLINSTRRNTLTWNSVRASIPRRAHTKSW